MNESHDYGPLANVVSAQDERIAALEAEVERLRGALKDVLRLANSINAMATPDDPSPEKRHDSYRSKFKAAKLRAMLAAKTARAALNGEEG